MDPEVLKRVIEISRRMAETRVLAPLLRYAMGEAIKLVGAQRGFLVLINDDGSFDFRVKCDKEGNELENGEDQISHTIVNHVINEGESLLLADALSDDVFGGKTSVVGLKLRSVMCVPLIARGNTIGAIFVENRLATGRFEEKDKIPLTLFANQAAVAIENALLNDGLEQLVEQRTAELAELNANLQRNWAEAMDANRDRTTMLATVAHDLRNPVAAAIMNINLFADGSLGQLNPRQKKQMDKVRVILDYTMQLIRDIFDLTRAELGQVLLTPTPVDLKEFLSSVYSVGLDLSWPMSVTFRFSAPDELPTILIDPVRIRQVLLNLISNALKFTEAGSVVLYAELHDDEVLIGVSDTGKGIPADKLEEVFKPFVRLERSDQSGAGLGLAISRELVQMHDGRIWVESELGKGSDFRFTLPLTGVRLPG
jgi:signal transduction histidine kinase